MSKPHEEMSRPLESDEQKKESPSEKLEDGRPTGSLTPGTQKPESEVQSEKGMNTE